MPRPKIRLLRPAAALGLILSGCAPKERTPKNDRARMEDRLAAEIEAERAAAAANRAITEMNAKAFRRRTPEEEAQHKAEVARQVEQLREERRQAEAKAAQKP